MTEETKYSPFSLDSELNQIVAVRCIGLRPLLFGRRLRRDSCVCVVVVVRAHGSRFEV